MLTRLMLALGFGLFAAQALAKEAQLPFSKLDHAVTFQSKQLGDGGLLTLRFAPGRDLIRMELWSHGELQIGLIEMKTGAKRMWGKKSQPDTVFLVEGKPPSDRGLPTDRTRTVLGEACRVWKTEAADICLAADGVLLAFGSGGNIAEAVAVERAAQAVSLFAVPEGTSEMRLGAEVGTPWPF